MTCASPVTLIKGWLQPEEQLPLFRSLMESGPNTIVLRQYGTDAKRKNLVFYDGDPDAAYRYVQDASPEQDPQKVARPIPFADGPPELQAVRGRLRADYGHPFSLVYINIYADETVGIGWHNDAEEIESKIPVKMLCLGGTRLFSIWRVRKDANGKLLLSEPLRDANGQPLLDAKKKPKKRSLIFAEWEVPTKSGDLVEMPVGFHEVDAYRYAVLPQRQYAAPRISLTFRSPDLSPSGPWVPLKGPKVWDCHAGKDYPKDAVYVGCRVSRGNRLIREGTIFGNGTDPLVSHDGWLETEEAFRQYAEGKMLDPAFRQQAEKLRGKHLLCWCVQTGPKRANFCHARIWLELING